MASQIVQLTDGENMIYPQVELQRSSVTMSSGWSNNFHDVAKSGRTVTVNFNFSKSSELTSNSWNTMATLPTGYRPTYQLIQFAGYNDTGAVAILCRVTTSGTIDVYIHNESAVSPRGQITFMI